MTENNARRAASRARTLGLVVRTLAAGHSARSDLMTIATHLDNAATSLDAGACAANTLPGNAARELESATSLAENSGTSFPAEVVMYVLAPFTGSLPELAPLHAVSPALAHQEQDLRARLAAVTPFLDSDSEGVSRDVLKNVLNLHRAHARLARTVAVDNARPCNRV